MKTRYKFLVIAGLVLAASVVGGYLAAPALVTALATQRLGEAFEVHELRVESVGLTRLELAVARLDNQRMRLDARNGVVRYDLWPFRVRSVNVGRAALTLSGGAGAWSPQAAPAALPDPAAFPLRVDELLLKTPTPLGPVSLAASLDARPTGGNGFQARLRGGGFEAVLTRPANRRYALDVTGAGGAPLVSVSADLNGGYPVAFNGRLDPPAVADWIVDSAAAPPRLKSALAPFGVQGEGLRFTGQLHESLDFTASLSGGVALADQRDPATRLFQRLEFQTGTDYTVQRSGAAWSGSGPGELRLQLAADTTLTGAKPDWRWGGDGLTFAAERLRLMELGLAAESVQAAAPGPGRGPLAGRITVNGLRMRGWPAGLAFYHGRGEWVWSQDAGLAAEGTGSGTGLPALDWQLDTGDDQGHIAIQARQAVAALTPVLKRYTEALARDLRVKRGEVDASYDLAWRNGQRRTELTLHAGPVDAELDAMQIRGLQLDVSSREGTLTPLAVRISAPQVELAADAVAEDLLLEARLSTSKLELETARVSLFGGGISLRPATVGFGSDEFALIADIDRVSLARIMRLFELETLELTGEVSGPVRMVYHRQRGLAINKGELHSVAPGVLRLTLDQQSQAAAGLNNIAMRALNDFQYDELNAGVLYKPDGEYRITARILGKNPEVLDGHPIALNPTIEGRLPAVFRALFITGDFSQAILQRLREGRAPSTSEADPAFEHEPENTE